MTKLINTILNKALPFVSKGKSVSEKAIRASMLGGAVAVGASILMHLMLSVMGL